jgi:7-cyano-7-deazaguanine reductase
MGTAADSPLGKATVYGDRYDPALLYAVERAPQRAALGLTEGAELPFAGGDAWTAWEAQWLDAQGRPQAAVARFEVPVTSPAMVESKSLKLYLTALNDTPFANTADFAATVARDVSIVVGAPVRVALCAVDDAQALARAAPAGERIDAEHIVAPRAAPDAAQLATCGGDAGERLVFTRFRSVCPVTGQPDYATVEIAYRGARIDRAALYAYLVAYRHHPGFHEHCVERMFVDVTRACAPAALSVVARFTRRGGIDINPWRATAALPLDLAPTLVQ